MALASYFRVGIVVPIMTMFVTIRNTMDIMGDTIFYTLALKQHTQ